MVQVSDKCCLFHRLQNLRRYDGICRWSALTLVRPLLCRSDQRQRRDGKKEEWFSVTASEQATVYLCDGAGPQEMHDDRKDIYGGLRSGICLCAWRMGSHTIYSTIWPTCCYCTESSAEDKLAFKWDKPPPHLWITNTAALIMLSGGKLAPFLLLLTQKMWRGHGLRGLLLFFCFVLFCVS